MDSISELVYQLADLDFQGQVLLPLVGIPLHELVLDSDHVLVVPGQSGLKR